MPVSSGCEQAVSPAVSAHAAAATAASNFFMLSSFRLKGAMLFDIYAICRDQFFPHEPNDAKTALRASSPMAHAIFSDSLSAASSVSPARIR